MKNIGVFSGFLISAVVFGQAVQTAGPAEKKRTSVSQPTASSGQEFANRYCAGCHNDKRKSGGFSFAQVNLAHPGDNAEQLEQVVLKLRTGMMPPAGAPRPKAADLNAFVSDLEHRLDRAVAVRPNPGAPALHR